MNKVVKNITQSEVIELKDLVNANPGEVVSKIIVQNDKVSMTLFAFAQGEEIGAHTSKGDALVTVLEGSAIITIDNVEHTVSANQSILMPADILHALYAKEPFKMQLTQMFE